MKYVSKDNLKQTVKAIKSYINTDRLKELDKFEDGAIGLMNLQKSTFNERNQKLQRN